MIVNNPILRGFYPDPSICKANGKYYMICSSFQYFPGVPIFESEDLIHWNQIGHCLTRPSQVDLREVNSSGGVFAPTIRYNDSTFYMVTTNDTYHKNFYITTNDIYGEWSEPIFVDQDGIDPSLFFEDGKTYFMSNGSDENNNGCIFQCEIDVKTGEKLTESLPIWKGSGGRYLESPHLYHIGDWYYIMAAEGGTEYGHMITYARGTSPYGPFVPYHKNPVLTNRNLGGHQSVIQGIGHGDLVQDDDGNTFMVCLGFRQEGVWVPYHHLGREVFLVPVQWDEDGWFTAGIDGIVKQKMEVCITESSADATNYDASLESMKKTPHRWLYLRDPAYENYQILEDKIRLRGTEVTINQPSFPTFLGIRQSEFDTDLCVDVTLTNGEAGVTFYMDENHHYDLALTKENDSSKQVVLRLNVGDLKTVAKQVQIPEDCTNVTLQIISDPLNYSFYCIMNGEKIYMGNAQTKYLSSEVAGGFTGVVMAMYAEQKENNTDSWAEFSNFHWEQKSDI